MSYELSLESMLGTLFTNDKGAYGLESEVEEAIKGDDESAATFDDEGTDTVEDVIEDADIAEDGEETPVEEETEDDETADAAADGDAQAALAEESARLFGEAQTMEMALRTAESYVWSQEGDSDNVFKKFWEWLKGIFQKIYMAIVTFLKKVGIWMSGSREKQVKYIKEVNDNKAYKTKLQSADVKLTTLVPSKKGRVSSLPLVQKAKGMQAICNAGLLQWKGINKAIDNAKQSLSNDGLTVGAIKAEMFGKDAKPKAVSAKDWFKAVEYGEVVAFDGTAYKDAQNNVKLTKDAVSFAQKMQNTSGMTAEEAKQVKENASVAQRLLNVVSTISVWVTSEQIRRVNVSYKFAKLVAAKNGSAASKGKKDEKKKK